MPSSDEVERLSVPKNTPVLEVRTRPYALAVGLPADRHELKDAYPIG